MSSLREILNKLKWSGNLHLQGVKIWYVHRGAPDSLNLITGTDILQLKHFGFVINFEGKETRIPYHRIKKITLDDQIIFEKF